MSVASFDPNAFLRRFWAMDAALVVARFPATSPWWRAELERFFRSGRRRWIIRAGRRAGKSSTLCRLAVAWALWGAWSIPPGDVAVTAFISLDRDEASARLRTIAAILRALGVSFDERSDEIELRDKPLVFRVVTCSIRSVGFTSVAVFGDEMARWESRDTAANPAREVMASLRPTMATQAHAFEVCSSSPWGTEDYHHELHEAGDTDHQVTSRAATWEANPTLSEQRTRELEPDERAWSREYAAIPGGTVTDSWFGNAVDTAIDTDPPEPILSWVRYYVGIDAAFASDRFGYCVVSSRAAPRDPRAPTRVRRITRVHEVNSWKPDRSPFEMALRLKSEVCVRYNVGSEEDSSRVFSDQFEGFSFRELARNAGVYIQVIPWTGGASDTSKMARFKAVRMAMLEGAFKIPNDPALLRELRSARGVLLPSGNERIEMPRTSAGHGDRVSAMVLAASMALSFGAQEPPPGPKPELTPNELARAHKERLAADLARRRQREWNRNPAGALRRALGMDRR